MAWLFLLRRKRAVVHAAIAAPALCVAFMLTAVPVSLAADVELGRYLSSECTTCHSPAAHSAIPNIHGMMPSTFVEVVRAYRDKKLENPVMQNVAARLKDEDIEALAAFFATAKRSK